MVSILKHSKAYWMPSNVKYFFLRRNNFIALNKTCDVKVGFKASYGFIKVKKLTKFWLTWLLFSGDIILSKKVVL